MSDILNVGDQFYVLATSRHADDRTLVLKQGDSFAVFDRYGDVSPLGLGEQGLFHEDTRFLSRLALRLAVGELMLLSAMVQEDNSRMTVDLTNADLALAGERILPHGSLHVFRHRFVWRGVLYERLRVTSFAEEALELELQVGFAADFADIFEVRGTKRGKRGRTLEPKVGASSVELGYLGLDRIQRRTKIAFDPQPSAITSAEARLPMLLEPGEPQWVVLTVACEVGEARATVQGWESSCKESREQVEAAALVGAVVETSNEEMDSWLRRSSSDLRMMETDTGHGLYPYAGVPWFSTVFGRDGIITALETLWLRPTVAKGVLRTLAAMQSREEDPARDAEPGKVLHETRKGEMARTGEVPFERYYGSVDSTPLFVMLAGETLRATGDRELIRGIWPAVQLALSWITRRLETGAGLVRYQKQSENGLIQQGWKDSNDSVFHADGRAARPPIALCEVQGYAFAALREGAELARALGHSGAERLDEQAEALRARFIESFWLEDLGTYALAIDGDDTPCSVRTSNAGHCLLTGIAAPEHAARVVRTLMAPEMFTGWGIRTVANGASRYNPISYHNGSVWPHDTAMCGLGMARYGFREEAAAVLEGLFATSRHMDLRRLPELFCGFRRRPGEGPTRYPVACEPQAWAAGAPFMLLGAILGLTIDASRHQVTLHRPVLPPFIDELRITGLSVGDASVDLELHRYPGSVGVHVIRRRGHVEVVTTS